MTFSTKIQGRGWKTYKIICNNNCPADTWSGHIISKEGFFSIPNIGRYIHIVLSPKIKKFNRPHIYRAIPFLCSPNFLYEYSSS